MTEKGFRRRLPLVALVGVCVAAVTVAVSGAADPTAGLRFAQTGHWIGNAALGLVFHVDGAAKRVDASVEVPGLEPGSQVVQGETSGFVIGGSRITEFGKGDLTVDRSYTPPTGERPSVVETDGGPYLVYKEAGRVVRVGGGFETIPAGDALGEPVATPDGTLWLQQRGAGRLCRLPKAASQVSCAITLPDRHTGVLTVVGRRAVFVDTTSDALLPVDGDALGEPVKLGIAVSAAATISPATADGRIAVFEPATRKLHLLDTGGLETGHAGAAPVTLTVPDGDYAPPVTSASSVVLLDLRSGTVLTYGADGSPRHTSRVPAEAGEPRLVHGDDDRVYVDGGEGRHVLVVDHSGAVAPVLIGEPEQPPAPPVPVVPPTPQDPPPQSSPPSSPVKPQPPAKPDARATAAPKPPVTPKPLPASPPGAVGNLRATLQGANAQVSWAAATANGAPITGYQVSWTPSSGAGAGSATTAAGTRTRTITALRAGTTYTVTVFAQNSAGSGTASTTTVTRPAPQPAIHLSQGSRPTDPADRNCGEDHDVPDCANMHVVMTGFEPNTTYTLVPHATNDGYTPVPISRETRADGSLTLEHFYYYAVGYQVWVTVGEVKSNTITWRAAS